MPLRDSDLADILAFLNDPDPRQRVIMLQDLASHPTGDVRLLPHLEQLLTDESPALIGLPFTFGEVRWTAAFALSAERKAQHIERRVSLGFVPIPLSVDELSSLADSMHVEHRAGIEGLIDAYAELQARGVLPKHDLTLDGFVS